MTDDVYSPVVNVPLPAIHKPTRSLDTSMPDRRDMRDPQKVWAEVLMARWVDCGPDQE